MFYAILQFQKNKTSHRLKYFFEKVENKDNLIKIICIYIQKSISHFFTSEITDISGVCEAVCFPIALKTV